MSVSDAGFRGSFDALARIGRNPATGGCNRFAWTAAAGAARDWFAGETARLGGRFEQDRNGNLWAWFAPDGEHAAAAAAVATGSHLDTVPEGGAYDGALGVVAGFLAVEALTSAGVRLRRPVAVVAFADEEGARFGVATFGSRLLTGTLRPDEVVARTDRDGTVLADAAGAFGVDPAGLGADPGRLGGLHCFVELHIEQGRALGPLGIPIAVASGIWPHGRWRLSITGEANHAGTTRMEDRRDPMLLAAAAVGAARGAARKASGVATVGRIVVEPNGTNVIPSRADVWLDARAPTAEALERLVANWSGMVHAVAAEQGVAHVLLAESVTPGVTFDPSLQARVGAAVARAGIGVTDLATAAGHDAGALAAVIPTAMLFVRNETGISHSPAEEATDEDCVLGVRALAAVLEDLAGAGG